MLLQLGDEAFAAVRIGVATVHEAVYEGIFNTVYLGDIGQFEQVVERRVHAAVRNQTHQVHVHAVLLRIFEGGDDLRIFQNGAVGTSTVDLHQILIDHAAGADIEVTHLRVAHLALGQTDVLAVRAQLGVRILFSHRRNVGGVHLIDHVASLVVAVAPTVQNHQ